MSKSVTIVDYGLGNLFSVRRALEHAGASVSIASTATEVARAERLVLPGVGSFKDGIHSLQEKDLIAPILEFASKGKPFMGICLGMQLLLSLGYEYGESKGLGLIEGTCSLIPNETANGELLKRPHIGWSQLQKTNKEQDWSLTPLRSTSPSESVYFVHSYGTVCKNEQNILAYTVYGGHKITAAIYRDNIYGFQFHPERSGQVGLKIMKEFINGSVSHT